MRRVKAVGWASVCQCSPACSVHSFHALPVCTGLDSGDERKAMRG